MIRSHLVLALDSLRACAAQYDRWLGGVKPTDAARQLREIAQPIELALAEVDELGEQMPETLLALPEMTASRRRLFTFTHPLRVQVPGTVEDNRSFRQLWTVVAGEGVADTSDPRRVFLVLDTIVGSVPPHVSADLPIRYRLHASTTIGLWVRPDQIASEQVRLQPWEVGVTSDA